MLGDYDDLAAVTLYVDRERPSSGLGPGGFAWVSVYWDNVASRAGRLVACCVAALAFGLIGVVTLAGGTVGTMAQIFSGEGSVGSAWVSVDESGVTIAGPYSFRSRVGEFKMRGKYEATGYVSGNVGIVNAEAFWRVFGPGPGGLQVPRPDKPWVSEPYGLVLGDAIGDVVLGWPLALTTSLGGQVTSVSSLGLVRLNGSPAREYRLALGLHGLVKAGAQSGGSMPVLGKRHPVLIWVDADRRLVKLSTSMGFTNPDQLVTITVTYSLFNLPVAVKLPPAGSVETLREWQDQLKTAWGCPPRGGECKGAKARSATTR